MRKARALSRGFSSIVIYRLGAFIAGQVKTIRLKSQEPRACRILLAFRKNNWREVLKG